MITWAGRTWDVKVGQGLGPGPNNWSDSTENVWVDTNGYVHLKVTESNGLWYSSEIIGKESLGFGEYRFVVDGPVHDLDTNVVGGLLTFLDDNNEIDIEFARAFHPTTSNNAVYSTQPAIPGDTSYPFFFAPTNGNLTTHRFIWEPTTISYESYHGDGDPALSSNEVFASWTYTGSEIPEESIERVHLNLWQFMGRIPSDTQNLEMVIRDFLFIESPLGPLPSTSATVRLNAEVVPGISALSVSPSNYSFGVLHRGSSNFRFRSRPLTCSYFAANAPWRVEVSIVDPTGFHGMLPVGEIATPLTLKYHQPNYGEGIQGADPDLSANWTSVWRIALNSLSPEVLTLVSSAEGDAFRNDLLFSFAVDLIENDLLAGNLRILKEYDATIQLQLIIE